MASNWDIGKDMTVKRTVTRDIVSMFPDCRGKPLCLMTSLTFNDLEELLRQRKIDGDSTICNVENLSWTEGGRRRGGDGGEEFSLEWRRRAKRLFSDAGIPFPKKSRLVFGDIFSMPLNHILKNGRFELVYADSCNTMTDEFRHWINCGATVDGVEDDGILAFTVALNHRSLMQFQQTDEPIDFSTFQFSGCRYDGVENMMHYARRMSTIRTFVESEGFWKVDRLIHYCERNRKSQMVSVMCRKAKKQA